VARIGSAMEVFSPRGSAEADTPRAPITLESPSGAVPSALRHVLVSLASTRMLVALVVLTLFLERPEKDRYLSGQLPFPDFFFTSAILALALRVLGDGELRRWVMGASPTAKEIAVAVLPVILGVLSLVGLLVLPAWMTNGLQISKTWLHLAFLAAAAVLLGRVLGTGLVPFALVIYFVLSVAVSALAIVQALDENVLHTGASGQIGLGSRPSGDFLRPYSTWSEPAYLGYSAVTSSLIGLWLIRRGRVLLGAGGAVISMIAVVLSGSAGPLILGPLLFLALLVTGTLASRRLLLGLAAAGAVSLAVLLPTSPGGYAVERVEDVIAGRDASVTFRREVNEALVDIWRRAPYTGVGLGDSRLFLPELVEIPFMPEQVLLVPSSSVYLGLLAETGPLGVAALVAALLALLAPTRTSERELEQLTRVLIVFVGLQFLVIGAFILPPFWWWASLRMGLDRSIPDAALPRQ
jgi:hypothetical protein